MDPLPLAALGLATAAIGAIGGVGGAALLVPILVVLGLEPARAAPLGLLAVAAGSLAAAASQIETGLVHHRLGVTLETFASGGALVGALAAGALPGPVVARVLAVVVLLAAVLGLFRRTSDIQAEPVFVADLPGEWPGTLSGVFHDRGTPVAYAARRLPLGMAVSAVAGVVAGLTGTGGGFLKTPAMTQLMDVPTKVAAATTTFTIGITAAAALLVHAALGHVEVVDGAAVVAGALAGGRLGALAQHGMPARGARLVLSAFLLAAGILLLAGGVR